MFQRVDAAFPLCIGHLTLRLRQACSRAGRPPYRGFVRAVAGADHVLIGRSGGIERDYATLAAELKRALAKLSA